jgi:type VI secretion system protein ImpL
MALGHVNDAWRRDVVPVCQAALFQRYPLYPDAREEVALRDFSDVFRPGGVIDEFYTKFLAPFVVETRAGFAAARVDGVPLPLRSEALQNFNRARAIRGAFFTGNAAQPGVKFSLRVTYLDPSLLKATMSVDGRELVYRHEAFRSYDLEWPTKTEASTVAVTLTALDGKETKVERSGPWSLFRLVESSGLSSRGATDSFSFTIGQAEGARVTYQLKAASVTNPFSIATLRAFRCPDSL